jgi:hypothetical protein
VSGARHEPEDEDWDDRRRIASKDYGLAADLGLGAVLGLPAIRVLVSIPSNLDPGIPIATLM